MKVFCYKIVIEERFPVAEEQYHCDYCCKYECMGQCLAVDEKDAELTIRKKWNEWDEESMTIVSLQFYKALEHSQVLNEKIMTQRFFDEKT